MKPILLIYPPFEGKSILTSRFPFPTGLLYISAYLESKGINSEIHDFSYPPDRISIKRPPAIKDIGITKWSRYGRSNNYIREFFMKLEGEYNNIVGISSLMSTNYTGAYEVAKIIKDVNPNSIIIIGGPHATADPDHVFNNSPTDYVCIGEGEHAMYNFLKGKSHEAIKRRSTITRRKRQAFIQDMDSLPFPKRHLLSCIRKTPEMYVTFSRGCPHNCRFCGSHLIQGRIWRHKSVDRAMEELKFYTKEWGVKKFIVEDDNLCPGTKGIKWLKELCKRVIDELPKIKLTVSHGLPVYATADKELCKLLWQAGFRRMVFPLESSNPETLKHMRKEGTPENYSIAVKNWNYEKNHPTEIILGYPFVDTIKTMLKTIIFIADHGGLIWASHFRLNKGTSLYEECIEAGYINKNYDTLSASTYFVETERFKLNDLKELAQIAKAANFGTEHGWNCFKDDSSIFVANDFKLINPAPNFYGDTVATGSFGYSKGQNIFASILVLRAMKQHGKPVLSVQDKNKIIAKGVKRSRVWRLLADLLSEERRIK